MDVRTRRRGLRRASRSRRATPSWRRRASWICPARRETLAWPCEAVSGLLFLSCRSTRANDGWALGVPVEPGSMEHWGDVSGGVHLLADLLVPQGRELRRAGAHDVVRRRHVLRGLPTFHTRSCQFQDPQRRVRVSTAATAHAWCSAGGGDEGTDCSDSILFCSIWRWYSMLITCFSPAWASSLGVTAWFTSLSERTVDIVALDCCACACAFVYFARKAPYIFSICVGVGEETRLALVYVRASVYMQKCLPLF